MITASPSAAAIAFAFGALAGAILLALMAGFAKEDKE